MPIPTITTITNQMNLDWVQNIQKIYPRFTPNTQKYNVVNGMSIAIAPMIRQCYLYAIESSRQGNPLTADSITTNPEMGTLETWGRWFIKREPFISSQGKYQVEMQGTGGDLPQGTILVNLQTQETYTTDNDVTIQGPTNVSITSTSFGEIGKLFINDNLSTTQVYANIDSNAIVNSIIENPSNSEEIEEYRNKIIIKNNVTPRGGSIGDYINYGLEVNGVKAIYPYNGNVLADGRVYVRADLSAGNDPQGTPPQSIIDNVQANTIAKANFMAPIVTFLPIERRPYTIKIISLSDTQQQSTVENIIKEYFLTKEPFIDGFDKEENRNKELILLSEIFSLVIAGIAPATINNIELFVKLENKNGFTQTIDLLPNSQNLFGPLSPADGSFEIIRDGGTPLVVALNSQSIISWSDYILLLEQRVLAFGIQIFLEIDGSQHKIKFQSTTVGSTSSILIQSTITGTDLTGANYFDIANPNTLVLQGGHKTNPAINRDILPQGTIGYAEKFEYESV